MLSLFQLVKFTVVLGLGAIFLVAINSLLAFIIPIATPPIVSEALALISMFLPFNASAIFSSIAIIMEVILIFMIANKIFNLNTWLIKDA